MKVTVRLFARARELVGAERVGFELSEDATVATLRKQLIDDYAQLESLAPHLLFAVENDYVTNAMPLRPGAEVAVFPPVSGG